VTGSVDTLQRALAARPEDETALAELEAACLSAGDLGALGGAYRAAAAARGPEAIAGLAKRLGTVLAQWAMGDQPAGVRSRALLVAEKASQVAKDREEAARRIAMAWRAHPDLRALEAARKLLGADFRRAPDWLLEAYAAFTDGIEARDAALELAGRHLDKHALTKAEVIFGRLAERRPDDPRVRRGLEQVAQTRNAQAEELALAQAEAISEGQSGPGAVTAWTSYGLLLAGRGQAEEALAAFRQAATAGDAPRAEIELEKLYRTRQGLGELATFFQSLLEGAGESRQVALRRKLFRLYGEDLGQPDQARAQLSLEASGAPVAPEKAFERAQALGSKGRWQEALSVLAAAERGATLREHRHALLLEQARIQEAELGAADAAERLFRRIRATDPSSEPALTFYRRWYREHPDPKRAIANLQQTWRILESGGAELARERLEVAVDLARLAAAQADTDTELRAWERVLGDDPLHPEANPRVRSLLGEAGAWPKLVEHLERWLAALGEGHSSERVEILFDILEIYQEKLGMEAMVAATYQRVVVLAPTNARALEGLAAHYEGGGRWRELVEVLGQKVAATEDPQELLALFGQIATLAIERVRSDAQAGVALEKMLEIDPGSREVLHRLRELHARRHDIERLYDTYQRELALLQGADRLDVLCELGRLAGTELLRLGEAVRWWREALAIDPHHVGALAALKELETGDEDTEATIRRLEERLASAATRKQRLEALQELGEALYTRAGDEERARRIFAEICEQSPFNTRARGFLQRIYVARRAWEPIRAFYAPREDWAGYAALLSDFAAQAEEGTLRADILVEAARVHEDDLGESRRATADLEEALAQNPTRVDVAERLLERYARLGSTARALHAYEAVARHAPQSPRRREAWREVAVQRERAGNLAGALEAWQEVLWIGAPEGDLAALSQIERLAEEGSLWTGAEAALAAALERLLPVHRDARETLHRRLGHLLRRQTGQPDRAAAHFQQVLALKPGDPEALGALEEIALSQGDFAALELVLTARAEATGSPRDRAETLCRLGELYEDVLVDPPKAARAYQAVLEETPEPGPALEGLRRSMADAPAALATALEELARRVENPSPLQLELAELYRTRIHDLDAAVEHYREVLADPEADHRAPIAALEEILADASGAALVVGPLERLYRAQNRPERLVPVLEAVLTITRVADDRLRILDEIAFLTGEVLGTPEEALSALCRRFREDPSDRRTWDELERMAVRADRKGDVVLLFRQAITPATSEPPFVPEDVLALGMRLANLVAELSPDHTAVLAVYEHLWAVCPDAIGSEPLYERLEEAYQRVGDQEKLAVLYQAVAKLGTSAHLRRRVRLDAVVLLIGPLNRPEEAVSLCEALLEEDPADREALERYEELAASREGWQSLADAYERALGVVPAGSERDDVAYRLGGLEIRRLGREASGIERLASLLGSPSEGAVARDALFELCHRDGAEPEHVRAVVRVLDAFHGSLGDVDGIADVRELEATLMVGADRAEALAQAAEGVWAAAQEAGPVGGPVSERLGRAFDLFAGALRADPGMARALAGLESTAEALGGWRAYVEVLEGLEVEPPAAHRVRAALARAVEARLQDAKWATAIWEDLLATGASAAVETEALRELERLYDSEERAADRLRVLELLLGRATEVRERARLLLGMAQIAHRAGRGAEARERLEQALEAARHDPSGELQGLRQEVVNQLVVVHTDAGAFDALYALLTEDAAQTREHDPQAADLRLHQAGQLAEHRLDDPERAITAYRAILESSPMDLEALEAMDRLTARVGRWEEKTQYLERLLDLARAEKDPVKVRTLRFTLAQIEAGKLEHGERAVTFYAEILAEDPGFVPALRALSAQAERGQDAARARAALADAYRRSSRPLDLCKVLERALTEKDAGIELRACHEELARLWLGPLEQAQKAWDHAGAAYAMAAGGGATRSLLFEVARAAGKERDLPGPLAEAARTLGDPSERKRRLEADVAQLVTAGADLAPIWVALLEVDPGHDQALRELEVVAAGSGRTEDMVPVLRARAWRAPTAEARRVAELELGARLLGLTGGAGEAAEIYQRLFEGGEGEARERLAALARQAGVAEPRAFLATIGRVSESASFVAGIADHLEVGLHDRELALELYRRAAGLGGEGRVAHREAMVRLLRGLEKGVELAELLAAWESEEQDAGAKNLWRVRRVGLEVEAGELGLTAALVELEEVAEATPDVVVVQSAVAEVMTELRAEEALERHFSAWLERTEDAAVHRRVAIELVRSQMRRPATAERGLESLEGLLESDGEDLEALRTLEGFLTEVAARDDLGALDLAWRPILERAVELGRKRGPAITAPILQRADLVLDPGNLEAALALAKHHAAAGAAAAAIRWYGSALQASPSKREAIEGLRQLAAGEHANLAIEAMEAAVPAQDPPIPLLLALARVLQEQDRKEAAIPWYEAALAQDPGTGAALLALTDLYREFGRATGEAKVLELRLTHPGAEDDVIDLRRRLGALLMDRLRTPDRALRALQASLPTGAADPEIRQRLERLYTQQKNLRALGELYEIVLSFPLLPEEKVIWLAKRAQTAEQEHNLEAAQTACQMLLEIDPDHAFAATCLERVARDLGRWEVVDEALSRRVAAVQDPALRAGLLVERAKIAGSHFETPEAALLLLLEADALAPEGAGNERVIKGLEGLLTEESTRRSAARQLAPRYAAQSDWKRLVNVLEMQRRMASDAVERLKIAQTLAEVAFERLQQVDFAARVLAQALRDAQGPAAAPILEQLAGIAARQASTERLVEIVGEALGEGGGSVQAWMWLGDLAAAHSGEQAIRAYHAALAIEPGQQRALDALEALYRQAGREADIEALWQRRLAPLSPAGRRKVLLEEADRRASAGPEAELGVVARLVQSGARDPEVLGRLERLSESAVGERASELVEAAMRDAGDWTGLAKFCERRLRATRAASEQSKILAKLAAVHADNLGDAANGFQYYLMAFHADPGARELLGVMGRLAGELGQWERFDTALEATLLKVQTTTGRLELLLQRAQILELKLGQPVRAIEMLEGVLEVDETHRGALVGLQRLFLTTGQKARHESVTAALAATATDPKEQRQLWRALYQQAEARKDSEGMLRACEGGLRVDPYDHEVALRLGMLYEAARRYDDLAALLSAQVEAAPDPVAQAQVLVWLGRVRSRQLDEPGAIAAWEKAWALDPKATEAAEQLEARYRDGEDWSRLSEVYRSRAERAEADAEKVKWLLKAAPIAEDKLGVLAEAVSAYEQALKLCPADERALDELIRISHRHRRWEQLCELYVHKADLPRPDAEKVNLLALAAEVAAMRLSKPDLAQELLARVFAIEPDHAKGRGVMARLKAETGDAGESVEELEAIVKKTRGRARLDALINLGHVYRTKLSRPEDAARVLLEARQEAPRNAAVNAALRELLPGLGKFPELKEVLVAEYEAAIEAGDRCAKAVALARLHRTELPDEAAFLTWMGHASEAKKQSREVAEELIAFHVARQEWKDAAPRLEWLVHHLEEKKLTSELPPRAHQLGQLLERLGEPERALHYYKMAMLTDGTYLPNLLDYGRCLVAHAQWPKAFQVYQNLLLQSRKLPDDATRHQVLFQLARAAHAQGQDAKARRHLEKLLEAEPGHAQAKALLGELRDK
jgi:tetratricopeptide (TPR) repeat protein